ncbi:MAG TPA: hypothetical protein VK915_08140 [Gaiellaceae bacterium]|nr:hypothetical protein [Gaiellaceae bacterium]
MISPTVERYLRLGLRLGRHDEGIVDAYFGPPELAAAAEAEPRRDPRALVADAEGLLDELDDGWLRDQAAGLRACAGALAGEPCSYADEVEGCYGLRPTHTDEAVFTAAHEELETLLPGEGTLAERYQRWQSSSLVPADRIESLLAAVIEEARAWTGRLVELPDGERVVLEIVRDKPWWASCDYLGGLRSRVVLNADLPLSAFELLVLAAHETYPGHHAERASKEQRLVRDRGLLEETLVLAPTPQTLVTEGIGALAPYALLEGDAGPALAAILHDAGLELDLAHALSVKRAHEPCRWADVNAALLLHEAGAGEAEANAYLQRWGLEAPEWADHLIRFITEPSQRGHIFTYSAGRELCRAYVAGKPGRFRRLLTEQVRVRDLLEGRDAGATLPAWSSGSAS